MPVKVFKPALCLACAAALAILSGCSEASAPDDETKPARAEKIPRLVPAAEALSGADIPTLDPSMMNDAEIRTALGDATYCEFRYTSAGKPVLALLPSPGGDQAAAVIKLGGKLVTLKPGGGGNGTSFAADRIHVTLSPMKGEAENNPAKLRDADMVFEVGEELRAGFRGYYKCSE